MITKELTDEQKVIIESSARRKVIEAYAGTGKSFVLQHEAKQYPNERILYLVYGRKAKEDADGFFCGIENVDVKTIHSFAYGLSKRQWTPDQYANSVFNYFKFFDTRELVDYKYELATILSEFLNFYLNSIFKNIDDDEHIAAYISEIARFPYLSIFLKYQGVLVLKAKKVLEDWEIGKSGCPHDFYLKKMSDSETFVRALHKYDRVLVDEAQDLSAVMLHPLSKFSNNLTIVGDSFQSIYGFRYAINALQELEHDARFHLSKTFRFGNAIATFVNEYMQFMFETSVDLQGNPDKKGSIQKAHFESGRGLVESCAVLSRTNYLLFENAIECSEMKVPFLFERDVSGMMDKLQQVLKLFMDEKPEDSFIASFPSYKRLRDYVEKVGDNVLKGCCRLVDKYTYDLPDYIKKIKKTLYVSRDNDDSLIFSTIHSAKGKEYPSVYVTENTFQEVEKSIQNGELGDEESRILYVALTRASQHLYIPSKHSNLIDFGFRDTYENQIG